MPEIKKTQKHLGRYLVLIGVVLVSGTVLSVFLIDAAVERAGARHTVTLETAQPADCIIIPGAKVSNNQPSLMLRDRLDAGYKLYQLSLADRIIVSGDHGTKDYDEVSVMKQYLVEQGACPDHVFMDHAGFDTYDTLYRAQAIFQVRSAIVVTQRFHLNRALYISEHLGLNVQGVASDPRSYTQASYYRFREYPARVKAFIECALHVEPTFLGDPVPIHDPE
jgi:SanA protein